MRDADRFSREEYRINRMEAAFASRYLRVVGSPGSSELGSTVPACVPDTRLSPPAIPQLPSTPSRVILPSDRDIPPGSGCCCRHHFMPGSTGGESAGPRRSCDRRSASGQRPGAPDRPIQHDGARLAHLIWSPRSAWRLPRDRPRDTLPGSVPGPLPPAGRMRASRLARMCHPEGVVNRLSHAGESSISCRRIPLWADRTEGGRSLSWHRGIVAAHCRA